MKIPLLIAGASTRWLAQAAQRRGWHFHAADLFADWDTCQAGPVHKLQRLADVEKLAQSGMYERLLLGGGMEHHSEMLARLARHIQILGFAPRDLTTCRRPDLMGNLLRAAGCTVPDWILPPRQPQQGEWLVKPLRSGGGRSIRHWQAGETPRLGNHHYYQQFIRGMDGSALFIGLRGESHLIGICRQLIGTPALGASGFQFAGCIGPWPLAPEPNRQVVRLGRTIARDCHARGLFGVDFILAGEHVYPVEVNPRPTASAELFERLGAVHLWDWHWRACQGDSWNLSSELELWRGQHDAASVPAMAKGIVHWPGPEPLTITQSMWAEFVSEWQQGSLADIPWPTTTIPPHSPLLTLFHK